MTIPKSKRTGLFLLGMCLGIVLAATPRLLPDFWYWLFSGLSVGCVLWAIVADIRSSFKELDRD
jgi:hypothetical protein